MAGAGIGGLATAIALARAGRNCIVLESRSHFEPAGAGIQLGPNGVSVLQQLGIAERVRQSVGEPEFLHVIDGRTARTLAKLPLGAWLASRHGAPYWTIHRSDLHEALVAAAAEQASIAVRFGFAVASVSDLDGGVEVASSSGESIKGVALVGADGLWSAVRQSISAGTAPVFAGSTAARTVIAAEDARCLAGHYVGLWLGRGVNVVHYPVRGDKEIAVVIIARENWRATGWEASVDASSVTGRLVRFHPDLSAALAKAAGFKKWSLYHLSGLPRWSAGRTVLIGDAAHPMLPHLAQGGALALEDGLILSRHLDEGGVEGIPDVFRRFEAQRRNRATRVQALSRRNGRIYHLGQPGAWLRNTVLRVAPGASLMKGLDWLYGWRPE